MAIDSPWLTPQEAAEYRRCHINTIRKALRSGALKGAQPNPGGNWLIHRDAIDAWISSRNLAA
jgi:excisionase family DNA binding protein